MSVYLFNRNPAIAKNTRLLHLLRRFGNDETHSGVGYNKVGGFAANFFISPRYQSPVVAKKPEERGRLKQSRLNLGNFRRYNVKPNVRRRLKQSRLNLGNFRRYNVKPNVRRRLKQSRPHPKQSIIILIFGCLFRKTGKQKSPIS